MNISKKTFDKLILYTLTPLPFFLITGPFLSDLSVTLSGILLIIGFFLKYSKSYFKNYYFYFFIFWCLYLIFSSLTSKFVSLSLESTLFYFRFGIFVLAIHYALNNLANLLKYYKYIITICLFALFFDASLQYLFNFNIFGWPPQMDTRISSFFGTELKLGSYVSRLTPFLLGIIILDSYLNNTNNYKLIILLIIISNILVLYSGERAASLYIVIFDIFLILFIKTLRKYILVSFLVFISLLFFTNLDKRLYTSISSTIEQINRSEHPILFSAAHSSIYLSAYDMFKDHKITGIGPKNFREYCNMDEYNKYFDAHAGVCFTHPHNTYIQILTEAGILGAIPIFILLFYLIYYFLSRIKNYSLRTNFISKKIEAELCFSLCLFINLFPYIPTGNFFNNWLSVIYFLPIGFIFYTRYNVK